MKKSITILAAITTATVFAAEATDTNPSKTTKSWTHFAGAGYAAPVTEYQVDGNEIWLASGGLNLTYMGIGKSGFAVKADMTAGLTVTDNIHLKKDDDGIVGSYVAGELGLGYGFLNTPKWTVAAFATIGFEVGSFEGDEDTYEHPELGESDWTHSVTVGALTVGGDLMVRRAIGNHLGLFASVGGRWVPTAACLVNDKYDNDDYSRTDTVKSQKSKDGFSVVPTVGAMWRF
ncbi:hypothetical protein IKQ19_09380 [Candidatus Saccharibacteria bacterium]|nr:hypothetical protein [Candidatus Saccharibacteria bacterium]